jgi:PAS domain S-box-containing protein
LQPERTLYGIRKYLAAPGSAARGLIATLGAAGAVALVYYLAARLGLVLLSEPSDVAVFWPASGIAAGILIISGRRAYPALVIGVVVGTVAANIMSDRSFWTALLKGFCNAGEAALAAWLLERWFARPFRFANLRRVAGFLAAAVLATAASATGGAATMTLLHTSAPYWDVWHTWFLSDWVGIVVVAPLVIGLREVWREPQSLGEWTEGVGVLILTALVSLYTVSHETGSWLSFSPGALVLPLLLWLTARCPPAFGRAGAFFASAAVILATSFGVGRFGDAAVPLMERVRGAQVAVTTVTLYTLILIALFAQRKEAEGQLAKKSTALARLHEISSRLWLKRDLPRALDEILVGAIELLGADMGIIRILDPTRSVLKIEAHRGFKPEFIDSFCEVSAVIDSPCGRTLRSGERIVIADVEEDKLFTPFLPRARSAGVRAVLSTPIMSRDRAPLGTLTTHFRPVYTPAEHDLRLLDLYVRQAADIIQHHKAEDALRESEERLRLAQMRTGIGVWNRNPRTGKLTWSPELEALFGLEPGTAKSYADFRAKVHPDDIAAFEAERDAAVRRRETYKIEYRVIRPDGEIRWMLATGGAFYDEVTGEPTRLVGNNADITERKQAELALAERNAILALAGRTALVSSHAYNADLERMTVSESYAAIHGLPEGTTESTRTEWRARVHPEDLTRLEEHRAEVFRGKRDVYNMDYRIVRASGDVRWIEARGIVSYDNAGNPQRVVGINIDVTERKRAEERQGVLVAELDHRVKNVLATVSAIITQTQEASSSHMDFVTALNRRINSLARTHELLSESNWRGASLAEIVRREFAPYATGNAEARGPSVTLKAEATQAVATVLHELTTNAAKYGAFSSRAGRVSVQWRWLQNGSHDRLLIEWQETGGPPVIAPSRSGYGTSIIRELIPFELGGAVEFSFAPEGTRCRLEIPGEWAGKDERNAEESSCAASQTDADNRLS